MEDTAPICDQSIESFVTAAVAIANLIKKN